jgi:hypothetical protein
MWKIPHCLENLLRDWVDCQPHAPAALYSPETFYSASGIHFRQRLSKFQSLVRLEELGKLKKSQ